MCWHKHFSSLGFLRSRSVVMCHHDRSLIFCSWIALLPNYWPSLKTICQVFVEIWYFQFFVDFAPFLTPVQLHTTSTSEIVALELIAVGDFPYFPLVNKLTPKYEIALIFCSRYANKFIFGPNQDDKNHFREFLSRIWSMTSCYGNMTDFAICKKTAFKG